MDSQPSRRSSVSRSQPESWVGLHASAIAWSEADTRGILHWRYRRWDGSVESLKAVLVADVPCRQPQLLLGPSLARHWLQAPSTGASYLQELHAIARARAVQLFSMQTPVPHHTSNTETGWHVSGDWQASRPFLCAAWPASLSLLSLPLRTPLITALSAYRTQLPRTGWLAITLANELHLMSIQEGHLGGLRSRRLLPDTNFRDMQDRVTQEWQRDQLRDQAFTKGDQRLHWLHLMPSPVATSAHKSIALITLPKPSRTPAAALQALCLEEQEACFSAWVGMHVSGDIA